MNTMDDTDEMIECPTCHGDGIVEHGDGDHDDDACPTCLGDGAIEPGAEIHGDPAETDTPHGLCDDEPAGIDDDAGYDPYTGSAEDDGYDTGCFDDFGCDGNDF